MPKMLGLLFKTDYGGNELPYAVAALSLCMLFLWRLFKFSLVPVIWTQEPKEAPYWIPSEMALSLVVKPVEPLCTNTFIP